MTVNETDQFKATVDNKKYLFNKSPNIIFQNEDVDCGPACLANICSIYGKKVSVNKISQLINLGSHGASFYDLDYGAKRLGFDTYPCELALEDFTSYKTPFIAMLDYHYIVVTKVKSNNITFIDPEVGKLKLKTSEFKEDYSGYAILINKITDFKMEESVSNLPSVVQSYVLTNKLKLSSILFLTLFIYIFQLSQPILIQSVFDKINLNILLSGIALFLIPIFSFISFGLSILRKHLMFNLSSRMDMKVSENFFEHFLENMNLSSTKQNQGLFQSQFNELKVIQEFILQDALVFIFNVISFVFYTALLFSYDYRLSLMLVLLVSIYLFTIKKYSYYVDKLAKKSIYFYSKSSNLLIELFTHKNTIKSLSSKVFSIWRWRHTENESIKVNLKEDIQQDLFSFISTTFSEISRYALLSLGLYLFAYDTISLGQVIAIYFVSSDVFTPLDNISEKWDEFKKFEVACENINELLSEQSKFTLEEISPILNSDSSLEIKNLTFQYKPDRSDSVFENLNLVVKSNQKIAIFGKSGSGKTTLANLLASILEPTKGSILKAKTKFNLNSKDIVIVGSKDKVLIGSFAENIAPLEDQPDLQRIYTCAKIAGIHEVIQNRKMSYNELIRNESISGGERQRLNIARALYLNPNILILDEPLTEVDDITANEVISNLESFMQDKTLILLNNKEFKNFKPDSTFKIKEKTLKAC